MHFRGILPCIFEGVWQTPDNPLAGEHALRNLQRIAPCEGYASRLLRSPTFPAGRGRHEPLAEGARHHERAAGLLHAQDRLWPKRGYGEHVYVVLAIVTRKRRAGGYDRHERRLPIARGRVRKHLPAQAIEIRNAVGNLVFAQLHLDARPSAIAKLEGSAK